MEELSGTQVPGLTPSQPRSSLLPILCPRRQNSSLVPLGLDRTGLSCKATPWSLWPQDSSPCLSPSPGPLRVSRELRVSLFAPQLHQPLRLQSLCFSICLSLSESLCFCLGQQCVSLHPLLSVGSGNSVAVS